MPSPRLARGQELIYSGTFNEEHAGQQGLQFNRSYRLETRVFVMDTSAQGADVAIFTALKLRPGKPGSDEGSVHAADPGSVRLEFAHVDLQGRVTGSSGAPLMVPLDGPATVELGEFVEFPRFRLGAAKTWDVAPEGRPPQSWQVAGTEVINGARFWKLLGVQQSEDWDQPRGEGASWRRTDTVWLPMQAGVAFRVERIIERREPAQKEVSQRTVARFELESDLVYPGEIADERRRKILQARHFAQASEAFYRDPGKHPSREFDIILSRLTNYLEDQPPVPYRDAVIQVKHRLEAARRGEALPVPIEEPVAAITVAEVGQRAPDFVAHDLTNQKTMCLHKMLGQPIVMVFFSPTTQKGDKPSPTAEDVLPFAQGISEIYQDKATVLGLSMAEDDSRALKLCEDLTLTIPILRGTGLRQTYGVETTPKIVILDSAGVVRGGFLGWGPETQREVLTELHRWVRP